MYKFIKILFFFSTCFLAQSSWASISVCAIPQLYEALEQIKEIYLQKNEIEITYGSASTLYSSISNKDLRCDIYLGNDKKFPVRYINSNLAEPNSITIFTKTKLALWSITAIVDKDCSILKYNTFNRITLPDPRINVSGYESIQALKNMKIDIKTISQKFLVANNEYLAMSFVQNGNAILGFTTEAMLKNNSLTAKGSYCYIPEYLYDPLYYYLVIFKGIDPNKINKVKDYSSFLFSEKAKNIFKKNGFN